MSRLVGDERAVSELIGFILVITLVVLVLAGIQAFAVPNWNLAAEHDHSDDVEGDILDLRGAMVDTAGFGNERSTTVDLGLRYPNRILFVNPPPADGRLQTLEPGELTLRNVDATGDAGVYWDETRTIETQPLQYSARYNERSNAPRRVIEHGFLFNRFEGDVELERAHRNLLDGNRIGLITVAGDLHRNDVEPTAVETTPASAPTQGVSIGAADGDEPIELDLPTTLGQDAWEEAIGDRNDPADSDSPLAEPINVEVNPDGYNVLELRLDPAERYQLRLSRVGVGNVPAESPAYLASDGRERVPVGEDLSVQVRDRFDNPVAGEPVDIEVIAGDCRSGLPSTKRSDSEGRVFVACDSPATVEFSIGGEDHERIQLRTGAAATGPPELDRVAVSSDTDAFETLDPNRPERTLSQVTVEYDVSETDRPVEAVAIELLDGAETVTATTHTIDGEPDGQWVTPWLDATAGEVSSYDVEIRAIDDAGTATEACRVSVGSTETNCP